MSSIDDKEKSNCEPTPGGGDEAEIMADFNTRCTRCMSCEMACPLTRFGGGIGPMIRKLTRQGTEAVKGDQGAWKCTMCMRCEEVCPVDLKPRRWLVTLRRGYPVPEVYKQPLKRLAATGFVFPNPAGPMPGIEEGFPWGQWLCSEDA